jgi:formylglycine-generating enzyme required for sulfatase activity
MFPPNKQGIYDLHVGASRVGVVYSHTIQGNVWQWVEDHFNGLNGFSTSYLYDDFSSPCFDSRHSMILGGLWDVDVSC